MLKTDRTYGARWLTSAVVLLMLDGAIPDIAHAQNNSANISGKIGLDFSNAYFFRGIKREQDGLIAQPYGDLTWKLFHEPAANGLHSVDFTVGTWNSLHTGPTGSGKGSSATHVRSWYESDFFTGVTLGLDNWEAGITYRSYMSPNTSFGTISEISSSLAMDDSELFGTFAMNPHVVLAIELDGQADGGDSEGVYFEAGIEPAMNLLNGTASLSFPLTFGVSMSDYYENGDPVLGPSFSNTFGYLDVGSSISYPIPNTPEGYGDWELSGEFHLLTLGSYLEFLSESAGIQGADYLAVGVLGVNIGF